MAPAGDYILTLSLLTRVGKFKAAVDMYLTDDDLGQSAERLIDRVILPAVHALLNQASEDIRLSRTDQAQTNGG